jgi:signal transduction histidine kinase
MRRLLSLLREAGEPEQHSPQPSLARLEELVGQVEAAGVPVQLTITGVRGEAPPGVELSAYRIVQEALTNVLRHAGPGARTAVELAYAGDHIDLAVIDTGKGSDSVARGGGGHGLIGIRERVAVAGGTVTAGPEPEGGFAVRARLPYAVGLP